jgi:hypothetical protein
MAFSRMLDKIAMSLLQRQFVPLKQSPKGQFCPSSRRLLTLPVRFAVAKERLAVTLSKHFVTYTFS